MRVRLLRFQQVRIAERLFDCDARVFAGHANKLLAALVVLGAFPSVLVGDRRVGGHDVDDLEIVAEADRPVILIMRWGDLQEPGGVFRFGVRAFRVRHDHIIVPDHRDDATNKRQLDTLANKLRMLRVFRIDRNACITKVGLRTRRRDGDMLARLIARIIHNGIAHVPEEPFDIFHLDLVVGERGLRDGVPVDEALAAIDEPIAEQLEERFAYGACADVIHREALAFPVARAAHLLELVGDACLVFVFEVVDKFEELLAAILSGEFLLLVIRNPRLARFLELAIDHRLRRDPRVVCPRHPERLKSLHPMRTDQNVLDRVVERVTEVQGGGDIGWGDEDGVRLSTVIENTAWVRMERSRIHPFGPHRGFSCRGVVRFGHWFEGCRWWGGHISSIPGIFRQAGASSLGILCANSVRGDDNECDDLPPIHTKLSHQIPANPSVSNRSRGTGDAGAGRRGDALVSADLLCGQILAGRSR